MKNFQYRLPKPEQVEAVAKKLRNDNWIFNDIVPYEEEVELDKYIEHPEEYIQNLYFVCLISSVQHLNLPRLVRIKKTYYRLTDIREDETL